MSQAFDAAMRAMERGAYDFAIRQFQIALADDPANPLAHALISIALSNASRRYAARVEARRALELAPDLPLAHVADAYAQILYHDWRGAGRAFERALETDPDNHAARLGQCRMARARRDPVMLEAALAAYRALAPDDPEADVLDANLHLMRGDLDAAEASARTALRGDPDDADGHTALGWVHARRGDAEKARQSALTALNLAPDDRAAHELLAHAVVLRRPLLGTWQRFSLWLAMGGAVRIVAVLIGLWICFRFSVAILEEAGFGVVSAVLQVAWLACFAIAALAGFQYRRRVERELERAELDPDY